MINQAKNKPLAPWRLVLHHVIFEADTPAAKGFDVALIGAILVSIGVVMLDSVAAIHARFGTLLWAAEWGFTVVFTVEYASRIISVRRPNGYIFSFFGLVDLLAILPTYLSLVVTGTQSLLVIRSLRLLRIFRVFKLAPYLVQADELMRALRGSRRKIVVFVVFVLSAAGIVGAVMYLIEGDEGGFTSIPEGMYWAVVTMTTVGYGDITPQTVLGKIAAGGLMILGYGLIAVPTGVFSVELALQARAPKVSTRACLTCSIEGHDPDAKFCKACGAELE